MEKYGQKNYLEMIARKVLQITKQRKGWVCTNMGAGHVRELNKLEAEAK